MESKIIICSKVYRKNINSSGDYVLLITDSAQLVQTKETSSAGNKFIQKLDIVADIDNYTSADLQTIPQLFKLTDSEGTEILWGDSTLKSRCESCQRERKHTKITFRRVSTKSDL